jgi:hypothetical protein
MANAWVLSALWVGLALVAVGTVIASAVIPTLIANTFFRPRDLLPERHAQEEAPLALQGCKGREPGGLVGEIF